MYNLRPSLVLLKPRPPRSETDCIREALKFLRSWRRAVDRLAVQESLPCTCAVPVRCFTDGKGGVIQECLRCGESNVVERQPGIPTVNKERAAELKMFGPAHGDDAA